jgi:hypothetical protein
MIFETTARRARPRSAGAGDPVKSPLVRQSVSAATDECPARPLGRFRTTPGLAAIDAVGGACVVQDPTDAFVASMPTAALAVVPTAVCCPTTRLADAIVNLTTEPVHGSPPAMDPTLEFEAAVTEIDQTVPLGRRLGQPAPISCPDCTGGMNRG